MIKVNQIEKNYGKFHLNCTMEVPDGCVTGLIGENGAGKSTVFKAIENLIFLDGGSIEVFGKPHTELNAKDREQIAIVLSDATFSNVYTIKDVARIMGSVYPDFDKKKDTDQLLGTYGVLKMTEEQYRKIDHSHLLRRRKEIYGYSCLTDEIHYYAENYPGITVEKGSIDEIIMLMVKGEAV